MMKPIDEMSREELLQLVEVYAKNWLAHDGCWFLAIEERYGLDKAIELDTASWERFASAEAKRIVRSFNIPEGGGLEALEQALQYRLYTAINKQEVRWLAPDVMEFSMVECRVQQARSSKNLPPFPCKPVGMTEFSVFARTVDPRIRTECVSCPPDPVGETYCTWRFLIGKDQSRR